MAGNNGYFVAQADGKCRLFYCKNKLAEFKAAHGLATNAHRRFRNIYDAMSFMADPDIYVSHPLAYRVKDGKVSLVKKRTLNCAIDGAFLYAKKPHPYPLAVTILLQR